MTEETNVYENKKKKWSGQCTARARDLRSVSYLFLVFDTLIIPSMKISHNGTTPSENEASLNFLLSVSYFASIITDRLISVAKSEQ